MGYTDSEGKTHAFKVPEDKVDEAFALIENEDFDALKAFESVDA